MTTPTKTPTKTPTNSAEARDRSGVRYARIRSPGIRRREEADGDDGSRGYDVVISTDTPIRLWGSVFEVLEPGGATERMPRPPVLVGHDHRALPIGYIESITPDGHDLRAQLRIIDDGSEGSRVIRLWEAGAAEYLSVGYTITEETRAEDPETGMTTYTATRWSLHEVSVVGVPADTGASIKRDGEPQSVDSPHKKGLDFTSGGAPQSPAATPERTPRNGIMTTSTRPPEPSPAPSLDSALATAASTRSAVQPHESPLPSIAPPAPPPPQHSPEDQRCAELTAIRDRLLGSTLGADFERALHVAYAHAATDKSVTPDAFRSTVSKIISEHGERAETRESEEARQDRRARSSIELAAQVGPEGRRITAASMAHDVASHGRLTGAHEHYHEGMRELGLVPPGAAAQGGFYATPSMLGLDILRGRLHGRGMEPSALERSLPALASAIPAAERALPEARERLQSVGASGMGDSFVDEVLLSGLLVGYLFDQRILGRLGLMPLSGLVGDIILPTVASDITVQHRSETGTLSEQSVSTGEARASISRTGTRFSITRQLLIQSSVSAQSVFSMVAMESLEVERERAFFQGSGTNNEPQGVVGLAGTLTAATGANGGTPTYGQSLSWGQLLAEANVPEPYSGILTPAALTTLMSTQRSSGGGDGFIIPPVEAITGSSMLSWPLNGCAMYRSTLLPKNGSKGSGTNLQTLILGNWAQSYACMWGDSYYITVDPYTAADEDRTWITINSYYNFLHAQPTRILKVTDIARVN